MPDKKTVMIVGIEPTLIDFSSPDYAPYNLTAAKVMEGLAAAKEELNRLGYDVELCLTDFGETAEATVRERLQQREFHCIVIGAGVRAIPSQLLLFEKVLNVIHMHAPHAKICFNTNPHDTVEAVQRWL